MLFAINWIGVCLSVSGSLTCVQDVYLVEAFVLVVASEDHHQVSNHGGAVVRAGSGVGAVDGGVTPVPPLRVQDGHVVLPLAVSWCVCTTNKIENGRACIGIDREKCELCMIYCWFVRCHDAYDSSGDMM